MRDEIHRRLTLANLPPAARWPSLRIEFHHRAKGGEPAIMHVRRDARDIPERGSLERPELRCKRRKKRGAVFCAPPTIVAERTNPVERIGANEPNPACASWIWSFV